MEKIVKNSLYNILLTKDKKTLIFEKKPLNNLSKITIIDLKYINFVTKR